MANANGTVLLAKSDSDAMFVYKAIRDLELINHKCINPIMRIGLLHKRYIDLRKLKWSVQGDVLFNNCKHIIMHCHSCLARRYLYRIYVK